MTERKPSYEAFDDYLSGSMPDAEAESFEEALFAGQHGEEAAFFDEFSRLMRFAARHAPIGQSGTRESVALLVERGVAVHQLDLHAGVENVVHPWGEGYELVVTRLHVDARGYDQVHIRVEHADDGEVIKVFHDIGCDPVDGHVYAMCEEPLAHAAFLAQTHPLVCRILGERDGERTEIGAIYSNNVP